MPIREYACEVCGELAVRVVSHQQPHKALRFACDQAGCAGEAAYAGLSGFSVRTPLPTGGWTKDGKFIKGWFGSAPRRNRRSIKTFP